MVQYLEALLTDHNFDPNFILKDGKSLIAYAEKHQK
jgi:hypothetical protein